MKEIATLTKYVSSSRFGDNTIMLSGIIGKISGRTITCKEPQEFGSIKNDPIIEFLHISCFLDEFFKLQIERKSRHLRSSVGSCWIKISLCRN